MIIDYENNKSAMDNYIEKCRKKIETVLFYDEDLREGELYKSQLIEQGLANEETTIEDVLRIHRNQLIQQKIDHTVRIVESVDFMSQRMNIPFDFNNILKIAALLHDIGRFDQAVWSNTYKDKDSFVYFENEEKNKVVWGDRTREEVNNIGGHARWGYMILTEQNEISNFDIPIELIDSVEQVVLHHGDDFLPEELNYRINSIKELDLDNLSELEKYIVSTLVQMVRDVDKLDIFYQHLAKTYPLVRPYLIFRTKGMTLEQVANYFEIGPKEIMDYNKLKSTDISNYSKIFVPLENVKPSILTVPQDIQDKFFNNERLILNDLICRQDYSFIVMIWWRLAEFLKDINFISTLEVIQETELLDKLFELYPDKYKELVRPAFEYAKEFLIEKPIEDGKTYKKIYNSTRKK